MTYRDDAGSVLEAPTADGKLCVELAPRHLRLAVANRTLDIADRFATVFEHGKRAAKPKRVSFKLDGRVVIARAVPQEDLGIWIEVDPGGPRAGMRRIFGVGTVSLLDPTGLAALAALDRITQSLRDHLAGDARRAIELGPCASGGLDKVLLEDHGDHFSVYVRRLFRDRARLVLAVHDDGRIVIPNRSVICVQSCYGVDVVGDNLRFADPQGRDLAKLAIPWIAFEDRTELARRIGQLIDRQAVRSPATSWPPQLTPDSARPY